MLSSGEALVDEIELAAREVISRAGQPDAVGIGVPSQIEFATGTRRDEREHPARRLPLREELGRRFGVPVYVDNDANCAALAEAHIAGAVPPALVMLTLGTGVGGGVVIDGHVTFRGATGLGAELGHIVDQPGRPAVPRQLPEPRLPGGATAAGQALERDATELVARQARQPPARAARRRARQGRPGAPARGGRPTTATPTPSRCSEKLGACSAWASRTT